MVLLLSTHLNLTFTMRGKSQVACKLKKKLRIVPSLLNCPCIFTSKSLKKTLKKLRLSVLRDHI